MILLKGMAQTTTSASVNAICSQPTRVIGKSSKSEFLGTKQGVQQIEAEPDGHDQSKDRFDHRSPPQSRRRPVAYAAIRAMTTNPSAMNATSNMKPSALNGAVYRAAV